MVHMYMDSISSADSSADRMFRNMVAMRKSDLERDGGYLKA